jgi:thiamine biosynthesis lipoprotein
MCYFKFMHHYQLTTHALDSKNPYSKISFDAMASPCEVLVRNTDHVFCHKIAQLAVKETQRIEQKFSRYINDNPVYKMNHSNGVKIPIDQECFNLLQYAKNLYELSDGLFDISSGILGSIWKYHDNAHPPTPSQIESIIDNIGFQKINFEQPSFQTGFFQMPKGMQIDFGGIAKEYAVDQVVQIISHECTTMQASFLVNFGGDLSAVKFKENDPHWLIGLESVNDEKLPDSRLTITQGSVATSGNTKRFIEHNGERYGHLLNPKTGYPIQGAPLSITAFANNCVLAGSFSSLAMLQGDKAASFLKEQSIKYRCIW